MTRPGEDEWKSAPESAPENPCYRARHEITHCAHRWKNGIEVQYDVRCPGSPPSKGQVVRTSPRNRVTSSEHWGVTGSRRPNIAHLCESGRKFGAPDPGLTCADTPQGQEGQVTRKFSSRTRVTCARQQVADYLTLLTLPRLEARS